MRIPWTAMYVREVSCRVGQELEERYQIFSLPSGVFHFMPACSNQLSFIDELVAPPHLPAEPTLAP